MAKHGHIHTRFNAKERYHPFTKGTLKGLRSKGVAAHAQALNFQKDGWSCGHLWLHLCDEVARHRGSA